jgi:Tfp pilus assembly protein PilX
MKTQNNRGVALVLALLMIVLLSVLVALIITVTNTEVWATMNYRLLVQARYAAEAGAQATESWIVHNYTAPTTITTCSASITTNCYTLTARPVQYTAAAGTAASVVLSAVSGVASNYSVASVQTAFNTALSSQKLPGLTNATYSTYATLLSMTPVSAFGGGSSYLQTWQITSQGTITGVRNAQVQVVQTLNRGTSSILSYGVFATSAACGAITFTNGATTNSFNSSAGTYAATETASGGNIGTNGNFSETGGVVINGSLSTPKSGTGACSSASPDALTTSGGSSVTGGEIALSAAVSMPTPSAPSPTPPTTAANVPSSGGCGGVAGCSTIVAYSSLAFAPGQYGNINTSNGITVHLSAGTYNINSLTMAGGTSLVLDSTPVVINIAGTGVGTALSLSGGALDNSGGVPANLQFVYGGSDAIALAGGTGSYAVVYAPNAPVTMSNGADWYGAIVGSTINNSGGTAVHFDRAITNSLVQLGNYVASTFSWSKY